MDNALCNDTCRTLKPLNWTEDEDAQQPVAVVFAINDYYTPYFSTLLASLLAHRSPNRHYDLIVLSEDLSTEYQTRLIRQASDASASLRFVDVNEAMAPYQDHLQLKGHFKMETYFRLLLPQLLPDYHKVLYLDADMICLADVAELFDTNIDGALVAACKDPDTTGLYNGSPLDVGRPDYRGYMDNELRIRKPYEYFQAGTVLFNLDAWREEICTEDVFSFAQSGDWHLLDQDVLNYFCQGRVVFVDMSWNVMYDFDRVRIPQIISYTSPELFDAYMEARKHPRIVHYAGPTKPWDESDADYAPEFWKFARVSPFYEIILQRMNRRDIDRIANERDASLRQEIARLDTVLGLNQELLQQFHDRITAEDNRLTELEAQLASLESELMRFENRTLFTICKETMLRKILRPAAHAIARGDEKRLAKIRTIYHKVHPGHNV